MSGAVAGLAERSRLARGSTLALFGLVTAVFAYGFAVFLRVQPESDLTTHIEYAQRLRSSGILESPHFLFQWLLIGAHSVGLSYEAGTACVLGACYGGMAVLLSREMERRGIAMPTAGRFLLVLGVLIASHVFLLTAYKPNLYFGYFVPIVYHNPTQQLNKLLALWIFFIYHASVLSDRETSGRSIPALGTLCVLSALAKPSFLLAFVPTAGLYALRDLITRRIGRAWIFAAGIGIPSALVLAWQAWLAYGDDTSAGVAFAPFVVFDAVETLYKLPASLAFPLVVARVAWRARGEGEGLRFTWAMTAIALVATLGLVETGERMMQGNFAWTGQTAVFLIYVESALFLLARPARVAERLAWAVFGLHVLCGIVWYGVTFSGDRPTWL